MEVGYKSRWWARCNHVCDKVGLWELVNLLWLRNINKEGMAMLGMKYDKNVWKKTLVMRIQEYGRRQWRNCFGINKREQQYVHRRVNQNNEKYTNGSVGARVRLMVRGGCLQVRGSKGMKWKYDDDDLLFCNIYTNSSFYIINYSRNILDLGINVSSNIHISYFKLC